MTSFRYFIAPALAVIAFLDACSSQAFAATWRFSIPAAEVRPWYFATSPDGSLYYTGWGSVSRSADSDIVTSKLRRGHPAWTNECSLNVLSEAGLSLCFDPKGNVFVIGVTMLEETFENSCVVLKYSPSGQPLWTNVFENGAQPVGAAVDQDGHITVSLLPATLLQYSADGVPMWTNRTVPSGTVTCDSAGNVAVVSSVEAETPGLRNAVVTKLDRNGIPLWTNLLADARNDSVNGFRVGPTGAFDHAGNLTIAASAFDGPYSPLGYGNISIAVVRYLPDGTALWTNRIAGIAGTNNFVRALAVTKKGSVFVAGTSALNTNPNNEAVVSSISNEGRVRWTKRFAFEDRTLHGQAAYLFYPRFIVRGEHVKMLQEMVWWNGNTYLYRSRAHLF